jgi:nuclear transport factor 2 (NTF2) superfamily protein
MILRPAPPFSYDALKKVLIAEDAWNTRDVTVRLNSVDLGRRFRSLSV